MPCPIPTSGSAIITSDCILYSQIVVTGKLNVTGIPDAQGNLPKIIGGGSNRLFKVESGGELVMLPKGASQGGFMLLARQGQAPASAASRLFCAEVPQQGQGQG